jgi:tRNA modification GTPase
MQSSTVDSNDVITALATPVGEAGLAVVRLSGADAFRVADRVFQPMGRSSCKPSVADSHTIHYGHVIHEGEVVDEVLISVMRAPRTFTREDVVELTCHGGMLASKAVLDATLAAGARMAEPGEFTRRAFLNGRIDLAQAEAIADLIHARTQRALTAANEQLAGKLSQRINQLRDQLVATLAHVEAHIDFPDEDIAPDTKSKLIQRLDDAVTFMRELLARSDEGQILRRGIRAAIIGRPNAGKSSLLNQLLGHERAIVSTIPGTTRDTIEEMANIRGVPVVFIDTAGMRESMDEIEAEGIRRSHASLERAELVIHVIDGSTPMDDRDSVQLLGWKSKKHIVVVNKCDLPRQLEMPTDPTYRVVHVSCTTGEGIDALRDEIRNLCWSGGVSADNLQLMINSRHQDALRRAAEATQKSVQALRGGVSLDLMAIDLHIGVDAIGEIVGKTTTEDILDSIFSQFCIGK